MFDEGKRIYVNDNSLGFMLEVTPLCGADEKMINIMTSMFTDGVPEGCSIQIINWASPNIDNILAEWQGLRQDGVYKKMAEKRIGYYQDKNWNSFFENPYNIRNFRLFIAVSIPSDKGNRGLDALITLREQLKSTLDTSGMKSIELMPDSFIAVLEEFISPLSELKNKEWDGLNPLKMQLGSAEESYEVGKDDLTLNCQEGSLKVRSFGVKNFPEVWAQWNNRDLIGDFYSDYLRMPCPFLSVFCFVYGSEEATRSKASMKTMRAMQKSSSGIGRFIPSVYEEERDWKFVNEKLKKGQKLVKAFYQVTLFAKEEEIESAERYLRSLYRSKGWDLTQQQCMQLQSFLAVMPFTLSEGLSYDLNLAERLKSMVTWSCANLAPLQGEWKGMKTPRMMLLGRRGQPFYWDPFDNDQGNYNVAVVGKSGSGKSVFMQELVASLVGASGDVVVIDDGRSFMNSCLLQGGKFVEFGGKSDLCINPFSIVSEEAFEEKPEYKEEVLNLLNLIIRQMCKQTEDTSDLENALIQQAIQTVWEAHRRKATVSHVAEYLLNHVDARAKDLGLMLIPFTRDGLYSRFFEGEANIRVDGSFFVFEFDNIKSKPDLQRIVLMIVIFLVSEKMFHGDRSRTTSVVIDEAWNLLQGSHFAEFIEGIARRARKYRGNLITGTQSIDDYYKNTAATAAIQNTDWFCMLSQNRESVESIEKSGRISLDAAMSEALTSLKMVNHQYSEVMVYGSSIGWAVGRLVLDPYSIALYSSKGEDFAAIKDLQAQGVPLEDAVEQVANKISRR
jgi:conjugal transfer ATP-binding protein TraC